MKIKSNKQITCICKMTGEIRVIKVEEDMKNLSVTKSFFKIIYKNHKHIFVVKGQIMEISIFRIA